MKTPEPTQPDLDAWCRQWLGAPVDEVTSRGGHLSSVVGLRLADDREVVVKIRPAAPRLRACADVQRRLWQAGFPCPRPLVGPVPWPAATSERPLSYAASAETLIPGGEVLALTGDAVDRYAELLARFIRLAPPTAAVGPLAPNPPWVPWANMPAGSVEVWPPPDDRDADLNRHPETAWLDEIAKRVRTRLDRLAGAPVIVGHGDWESQNLRWRDREPLVVHDWDSTVSAPEPVIVGLAAAVWVCGAQPRASTVDESAAFLDAYQRFADRRFEPDEVEASWAAGLWVYAFNAKKASLDGEDWLSTGQAERRLRRARA